MIVYIERILAYLTAKRKKMVKGDANIGKKAALQAGWPPGRPRPAARPGVSAGWPAPKLGGSEGRSAPRLAARLALAGSRPSGSKGRLAPWQATRPGDSAGWPAPRPAQDGCQTERVCGQVVP